MHQSKLAGFIIDCQTDNLTAAAEFWSAALGMKAQAQEGQYVKLVDAALQLHIEVQAVRHPSRVHLDIESDDVEAEASRLEQLGAKRIEKVRTWWVMEAPTGQRFCVIRSREPGFTGRANRWKQDAGPGFRRADEPLT